jgi:hypothetical protein
MSLMTRISLFIPQDQLEGLEALKELHGTPVAESIRRAIGAYLAEKGVEVAKKGASGSRKQK